VIQPLHIHIHSPLTPDLEYIVNTNTSKMRLFNSQKNSRATVHFFWPCLLLRSMLAREPQHTHNPCNLRSIYLPTYTVPGPRHKSNTRCSSVACCPRAEAPEGESDLRGKWQGEVVAAGGSARPKEKSPRAAGRLVASHARDGDHRRRRGTKADVGCALLRCRRRRWVP
jgi:hypothetical protein